MILARVNKGRKVDSRKIAEKIAKRHHYSSNDITVRECKHHIVVYTKRKRRK